MRLSYFKIWIKCFVCIISIFGAGLLKVFGQQIDISRIEMMPNIPSPYEMRDWKQVAVDYDSLVFNFDLTGEHLPLIWWQTNTINYPGHNSFGLHTVVGTLYPNSAEAINLLPSIISASLVGIDKSNQNGNDWVKENWKNYASR